MECIVLPDAVRLRTHALQAAALDDAVGKGDLRTEREIVRPIGAEEVKPWRLDDRGQVGETHLASDQCNQQCRRNQSDCRHQEFQHQKLNRVVHHCGGKEENVKEDAQQTERDDLIKGGMALKQSTTGKFEDKERGGDHQGEETLTVLREFGPLEEAVGGFQNKRKVANQHPTPEQTGERGPMVSYGLFEPLHQFISLLRESRV